MRAASPRGNSRYVEHVRLLGHSDYVKRYFARGRVYDVPNVELVDHRYFCHELRNSQRRGNCGLVRNVVAIELLQVTLRRKSHSNSYKKFVNHYSEWIEGLEDFDVIPEFIWITPELSTSIKHSNGPKDKWPAHVELYIPLKNVNENIWNEYRKMSRIEGTLPDEIPVLSRSPKAGGWL